MPVRRPERPFKEVRAILQDRARARRNPFEHTEPAVAEAILSRLTSTDRDAWVEAFAAAAHPHERRADEAVAAGDAAGAREHALAAYGYWRVARYPAPRTPAQRVAYVRSQEMYLRAAAAFDPPLETVEIPFRGRPGDGRAVVGHLRRPAGVSRPPLLIMWGGIDSYKEERQPGPYFAAGFATLAIDMPGTGDAPIAGSLDAERLWDDIFAWARGRADLDGERIAVIGNSTGGYWAAKLSRTHRDRIRAAVDNGGPVEASFSAEWIARAQVGEYPFDLAETLAVAFGGASYEDWVRMAPGLSLVRLGLLDRPSAPLLAVHGEDDTVFPVADARLLVERGADALIVPGGHLRGDTTGAIVRWLVAHVR